MSLLTTLGGGTAATPAILPTRSLVFNANTDYMRMAKTTFGTGWGNSDKQFSFGCHYKRTSTGFQEIISWAPYTFIGWSNTGNYLRVYLDTPTTRTLLNSTTAFNDTTSWHSLVVIVDMTQATDANKVKVYHDGSLVTMTGTYGATNAAIRTDTTDTYVWLGNYTNGTLAFQGYLCNAVLSSSVLTNADFNGGATTLKDVSAIAGGHSWPMGAGTDATDDGIHAGTWTVNSVTVSETLPS